jgi:dihydroorotase
MSRTVRLLGILSLAFLAGPAGLRAQEVYDLILKGGHVIDPKNHVNAAMDVAIKGGKIARVAPNIPTELTWNIVPVKGLYVVPGLIDIHVHVYASSAAPSSYVGLNGIFPDDHCPRNGVTTCVDAGSSGHKNFFDFKRRVIDRSRTRVLALLNIVGAGMAGQAEQNTDDMDPQATADEVKKNRGIVVGIKTAHFSAPEWTAVERAVEAGKLADVPVMVDFGTFRPQRPYQQLVLEKLRPGDISTHMYLRMVPMIDEHGKLLPYLAEARHRGVIFDVGHGQASFSWRQAVPAVKQGWLPDSISTDLHRASMNGGAKDMTFVMSKFLVLDVPLEKVIEMSTWNPAKEIKRTELGHLSVGAPADVAVLGMRTGQFGFSDSGLARREGKHRLECELTLRDGQVVWDLNDRAGFRFREPSRDLVRD